MPSQYKSNKDKVLKNAETLVMQHMGKACLYLVGKIKNDISRPNPTGKDPSLPDEPPKKVKGILRSDIDYEVRRETSRVRGFVGVKRGPAEHYGLYLETGTSKMAARPYLRSNLLKYRSRIKKLVATGK